MSGDLLQTKLYVPRLRPSFVSRPHLIEKLNRGLHRKLTLISAPAGFGKTTLVSEWIAGSERPSAWLSLDEGDSDPTRFLTYLVAALQTVAPEIGKVALASLQAPQSPPTQAILTTLLNEIAALPDQFTLVLDDYHVVDAQPIDQALTFLLQRLPPQMHLVITTREDPNLPLARLRARGQLTEMRVIDLRFTLDEATAFLKQAMGLDLTEDDIAALEARTEGWIAGLQLAALSMQGHQDDVASFISDLIAAFSGSHRFVLDYLVEEVLHQQPESVQTFLLCTSVLDRLCGTLCDAVCFGFTETPSSSSRTAIVGDPSVSGQEILESLERANLFIVPLDNERRWYRYHRLFADLLRQRLRQKENEEIDAYHLRASQWYEYNGLDIYAFHHAAAANDIDRAVRLLEGEGMPGKRMPGKGMPLYFRGAVAPVLDWLAGLETAVLDARPSLWVTYAAALSMSGQNTQVEAKLRAAEAALQDVEPDDKTGDLIGHIAAIRAMLAAPLYQVDTVIAQSRRALEYLHPDNLPVRTSANWTLGYAYQMQGNRAAAGQAFSKAIAISEASGNSFVNILASTSLGILQEADNQLHLAAETYRRVLQLAGDPPSPTACEAVLGLARLCYEWNDLDAAQKHAQQALHLAGQIENIDTSAAGDLLLARLKLVQGDVSGAVAVLEKAKQSARQYNFEQQTAEVTSVQALTHLHQGKLTAAAHLAEAHDLPISQARVHLAKGEPAAAMALLEPLCRQAEVKGWADEQLKVMVLQALAHQAQGETGKAVRLLGDALTLAEPGGFIRTFVDEGDPMAQLLSETAVRGIVPDYIRQLLAAFPTTEPEQADSSKTQSAIRVPHSEIIEPLSKRELEVLQLVAQGLSNREIAERLYLALPTVKGHNRNIYSKLQVNRRTEAVARARELGLL